MYFFKVTVVTALSIGDKRQLMRRQLNGTSLGVFHGVFHATNLQRSSYN
jgi:hypothetical protein